jgi:hypothetical protein
MVRSFSRKMLHGSAICMLMAFGALFAVDRCDLTFTGCPENFNGDTIVVPDNVVKMYSQVHACNAAQAIHTGGAGLPASILFVIDNTGSMKGVNGNDPTGARFNVVKDLLDTIVKSQPDAEVGLLVFREHLFFDTSTSPFYYTKYFKALSPELDGEPYQAYLPFMKLGQTYDGKQGINIMKDILTTDVTGGDLVYQPLYRNLRPLPTGGGGETNINGAFIGAKQAFLSTANPQDRQYIIFLGDGEPAGTTQAGLPSDYFTTPTGVANVPTTFTVYFSRQGITPPTLVTMTNNILVNGYSASNPKSNLWTIAASYTTLMNALMQNVISTILVSGNPTKMTLNNKTSTIYIDSSFFFIDSFPLTNDLTSFNTSITYHYVNPQTNISSDTIVQISFNVQKSSQVATLPPGVSEICNPGAPGSVFVTAILADTNHEGHLDRIDITWTDTSAINPTMPTVAQFINTLDITTLDSKKVTLTGVRIEPDLAHKTIHFILQENTGPTLETGWQNANVVLTALPMTVSGAPFIVVRIIDGAAPVIKSACFVPTSVADSLRVVFSEPVAGVSPPLDPSTVFTLYTKTGIFTFTSLNSIVIKNNDNFIYVFNSNTLSSLDSLIEGNRPAFHLALCGNAPIIHGCVPALIPYGPKITLSDRGCLISLSGYNREDLSVALFSVKGQSVAELKAVGFGRDAILWNYRDKSGKTVSNGLYVLEIRAGTRVIQQRIIVTR